VLGGGAFTGAVQDLDLRQSWPIAANLGDGWFVTIANTSGGFFPVDYSVTVYATCAKTN
jgi:hypothetical protein